MVIQQAETRTELAVVKTKLDSLKFKVAGISSSIGSVAGALLTMFFK
jgi:hypothetical protein